MKKVTRDYFHIQRFLLIDEMRIKSNLIFDKHSGELIGYLNLEDPEKIFSAIEEEKNTLATHAYVFYL